MWWQLPGLEPASASEIAQKACSPANPCPCCQAVMQLQWAGKGPSPMGCLGFRDSSTWLGHRELCSPCSPTLSCGLLGRTNTHRHSHTQMDAHRDTHTHFPLTGAPTSPTLNHSEVAPSLQSSPPSLQSSPPYHEPPVAPSCSYLVPLVPTSRHSCLAVSMWLCICSGPGRECYAMPLWEGGGAGRGVYGGPR